MPLLNKVSWIKKTRGDEKQEMKKRTELIILTLFCLCLWTIVKPTSGKKGCFLLDKCPLVVEILLMGILLL